MPKVVVSIGYPHDPIMAQFQKYGFVGVINKPFHLHDLQQTLQDILAPSAP